MSQTMEYNYNNRDINYSISVAYSSVVFDGVNKLFSNKKVAGKLNANCKILFMLTLNSFTYAKCQGRKV